MKVLNRFTGKVIYETEEANLYGANLIKANLSMADLSGANLINANLSMADLSGANLYGANLYGADLSGADLSGANLSMANLSLIMANLSMANLSGANLIEANLSWAMYDNSIILKYFTITRIGTRLDALQVYILESEVILKTGCFIGSPEELTGQLQLDKIEHQEYLVALDQIDAMAKLYQGGELA